MTDWPTKTLGELFESKPKSFESLKQKDYLSSGRFPVVDQGQELVGGFTNDQHLVRDFGHPVIVFGDHTRCVKYVDFPFVSGADGTKVLVPRKGVDPKFGYFQLLSIKLPTKGYARHFGELSKHSFVLPPLDQQKRIVALLDAATARVTEITACYEQARTHANNLFTSALRETLEGNPDWPIMSLDALCEEGTVQLGRGNIISKKDIAANPGSFPIYSSAQDNEGKFGEYGDYMFDEEMITWSIDGGGRLFYRHKHKFSVTNVGGTLRVLGPKTLDIQFLYRVLQNLHSQRVFDWVFKAHPSVIRKVYDAIPMPPLAEQKRIVARLDSMRAKTSEMVAAYDAKLTVAKNLRQSILEAAFGGDL